MSGSQAEQRIKRGKAHCNAKILAAEAKILIIFVILAGMISRVSIENYKSIKNLEFNAKRVNVFIGEHNSGKSNILEALSWFSIGALDQKVMPELFRFKNAIDFFHDFEATNPIRIITDELSFILKYGKSENGAVYDNFEGAIFTKKVSIKETDSFMSLNSNQNEFVSFRMGLDGTIQHSNGNFLSPFRTYIFRRIKAFANTYAPFLSPPFGENIPTLLRSNRELKELVSSLFKEKGFRLMQKPVENDINMAKDVLDDLYAYPYHSISETLQRIIFYTLAIESNHDAILILDEPDSNTFPMYTKQMAEMIAMNPSNQFFIATHNPYLLGSLVSKTPQNELAVYVTKMDEKYQTQLTAITGDKLSELLSSGIDFFFNLEKLSEK